MKKSSILLLAILFAMAAAVVACEKQDTQTDQEATAEQAEEAPKDEPAEDEQAAEQQAAQEKPAVSEEVQTHVREAAAAYDAIRAKLAGDSTEDIKEQAAKVQEAAAAAQEQAADEFAPKLEKLSAQAEQFQKLPEDADIAEVRKAFGDLSRTLVAVLSDVPALQDKLHVYECGMAKGYGKWVQIAEEKSNPYMGERMPKCGSSTDWKM